MYFPVYPNGEPAGAPIIGITPCDVGYSDAWVKVEFTVDRSVGMDEYTDVAELTPKVLRESRVQGVYNLPVVPPGSTMEGDDEALVEGWFSGSHINFFDLGLGELSNVKTFRDGSAVVSPYRAAILPNGDDIILEKAQAGNPDTFYSYEHKSVDVDLKKVGKDVKSFKAVESVSLRPTESSQVFNYPIVQAVKPELLVIQRRADNTTVAASIAVTTQKATPVALPSTISHESQTAQAPPAALTPGVHPQPVHAQPAVTLRPPKATKTPVKPAMSTTVIVVTHTATPVSAVYMPAVSTPAKPAPTYCAGVKNQQPVCISSTQFQICMNGVPSLAAPLICAPTMTCCQATGECAVNCNAAPASPVVSPIVTPVPPVAVPVVNNPGPSPLSPLVQYGTPYSAPQVPDYSLSPSATYSTIGMVATRQAASALRTLAAPAAAAGSSGTAAGAQSAPGAADGFGAGFTADQIANFALSVGNAQGTIDLDALAKALGDGQLPTAGAITALFGGGATKGAIAALSNALTLGYKWKSLGCLSIQANPSGILRSNLGLANSLEECSLLCAAATSKVGYGVFGMYENVCLCDYALLNSTSLDVSPSLCNVPCFGAVNEKCGGNSYPYQMSAYIGGNATFAPTLSRRNEEDDMEISEVITESREVAAFRHNLDVHELPPMNYYNYSRLGCLLNPAKVLPDLDLESNAVYTIEACADQCSAKLGAGWGYFSVSLGNCHCGHNLHLEKKLTETLLDLELCSHKCAGDPEIPTCGGSKPGQNFGITYIMTVQGGDHDPVHVAGRDYDGTDNYHDDRDDYYDDNGVYLDDNRDNRRSCLHIPARR
ncbi:hypothetical protein HK101_001215, partial [Irineochytrium annulatum]